MSNKVKEIKEAIEEILRGDENIIKQVISELNSWNGCLEHLRFDTNDEDFFETYFEGKPMEAVRAVSFGEYKYNDEYVMFNGYGNLETFNSIDDIVTDYSEIVEAIIDNENQISNNEILELLEELNEDEEENE